MLTKKVQEELDDRYAKRSRIEQQMLQEQSQVSSVSYVETREKEEVGRRKRLSER